MSAASTPAPRPRTDARPASPRHTLFLPMFILLMGLGAREFYQVMAMEDQLDLMTQTHDKLDPRVRLAEYERSKFYTMASEVLRLAPKDPNASQVATLFGLHQLSIDKPELMNASAPLPPPITTTDNSNNAAPSVPLPSTNAAPSVPAAPGVK